MSDPKVYVIDDDDAVRDSIELLLDTMGIAYASYPSATAFLAELTDKPRGVLVLDIRMPEMSGLELQQRLIEDRVDLPIVFITGHGDVPMAVEAMKKGAVDFIRKPFRHQELLDRINEALTMEADHAKAKEDVASVHERYSSLSPREAEVFGRVTAGEANKVIALELGISERTVEIHRSQVMRKMSARSLAELVRQQVILEQAG